MATKEEFMGKVEDLDDAALEDQLMDLMSDDEKPKKAKGKKAAGKQAAKGGKGAAKAAKTPDINVDDYDELPATKEEFIERELAKQNALIAQAEALADKEVNLDDIDLSESALDALGSDFSDVPDIDPDEESEPPAPSPKSKSKPKAKPAAKMVFDDEASPKTTPKPKTKETPAPTKAPVKQSPNSGPKPAKKKLIIEEEADDNEDEDIYVPNIKNGIQMASIREPNDDEDNGIIMNSVRIISNDTEEPAKPKKKLKKRSSTAEGEISTYENYFDYFAANFFNFLNYTDDPETAAIYKERCEEMLPHVLAGPDSKVPPTRLFRCPNAIPPFAHWKNIQKKTVELPTSLTNVVRNPEAVLNEELEKLKAKAKELIASGNKDAAKKVALAAEKVKKSMHRITDPCVLTTNDVVWAELAENKEVSPNEVAVRFDRSLYAMWKAFRLTVDIPGIATISGPVGTTANAAWDQTVTAQGLKPAAALRSFRRDRAEVSLWTAVDPSMRGAKKAGSVKVGLSGLLEAPTTKHRVDIAGASFELQILVNRPLAKEKARTVYRRMTYLVSPIALTDGIDVEVAPAPKDAQAQMPKSAPGAKKPPAAKTAGVPPPSKAKAQQIQKAQPQKPKLPPEVQAAVDGFRVYSDAELQQPWGLPVLQWLYNQASNLAQVLASFKAEVPPEIPAQAKKLEAILNKLQEDTESGKLPFEEYVQGVKDAIKREQGALKTCPEKHRKQTELFIKLMTDHLDEFS